MLQHVQLILARALLFNARHHAHRAVFFIEAAGRDHHNVRLFRHHQNDALTARRRQTPV